MCKVEGCARESMYKAQDVCQKHYFRFMRKGSYDLEVKSRKRRISNPAGYQKIYEPTHPLANSDGYVYEHRMVYFEEVSKTVASCDMCGSDITWGNCHIDHKDNDVENNNADNLRAVCRPCNVFRAHTPKSMGKMFLTANGKTLTPTAWARMPGVNVSSQTIRRRKQLGMSDHDSIFSDRVTHKSTRTKKHLCRTDEIRGIR